jgi:hypothetical protein
MDQQAGRAYVSQTDANGAGHLLPSFGMDTVTLRKDD